MKRSSKSLLFIFFATVFVVSFSYTALSGESLYQRFEPNSSAMLGEFLYDDDYVATTTPPCIITIKAPSGYVTVDSASMATSSDGWYSYTFTSSTTEGFYRAAMSCGSSTDSSLIIADKSFFIGPFFLSTTTIASSTWGYTGSMLNTTGNAITKIWSKATSTMDTAGSIGKHLVDNINASITSIPASVWGYSTRTLTAFGSLAADVWNNTYASTRRLTDKILTGGGNLATESYVDTATSTLETYIDTATSTLITQLDDIEYDVDLIRGATFDFSGFADAGSSNTTLVDLELNQPDDYWNNYRLKMMSGANVGEEKIVSDFDAASDTLTLPSDFTESISAGDKYVLLHEDRLVYQIWNTTTRTLSAFGTLAADVWTSAARRLTDKTLTDGGSLATETYIDTATSTLIIEIDANETLISALNNIAATDVWAAAARTLTDYSTSTIAVASAEEVWKIASSTLTDTGTIGKHLVDTLNATISSRGTSDLTATDVWNAATRTLTDYSTSTIAAGVWNNSVRTLSNYGNDITAADVWNSLSASLTTVDSIGKQLADNIDTTISSRASQASVDSLPASVWGYSTRTLSSFGNLAADVWTSATRRLTDKTLTDGGNLATESYIDTATSTIIVEIDANETLISALNNIAATDVWAAATRTLTDYSTSTIAVASAEEVWKIASSTLTDTGTIGKHLVDTLNATISSRGTSDLTATDVWNAATRTLTDYSTSTIAAGVWNNSVRTLSNYGNDITAADVWNSLSASLTTVDSIGKQLADNIDTTISSRASRAYIDTATSTLITEIDANETLVNNLSTDLSALSATTTLIYDKWSTYTASDIIGYVDDVESRLGVSGDATTTATVFGRANLLQELWGTQTAQTIFDKASSTLVAINEVQTELGYNGTSDDAYTDIQLIKGYVDELEGYVGTPDDIATSTLFGAIKDVRIKLDQLDTLETKLDTIDTIVDLIRASQQLDYTVELSDVGEVLQSNTYRAILTVLDYESNPTNALAAPTITIYNSTRGLATTSSMTATSTGVYEFTYTVPSDATSGLWETIASVDLGGANQLTLNDYWEVEGSPAQVIINSISDTSVPSITANVTIENEGNADYEYQYEWCVVTTQDNQCGGADDVDYASAAKLLSAGESWTTGLNLTVPDTGDYWFKVVVYYGTEASGASRTFTAVEEEEEEEEAAVTQSSGAVILPSTDCTSTGANLSNIYCKLLEVQNELGYHGSGSTARKDIINTKYSLGDLPEGLDGPIYSILSEIGSQLKAIGGKEGYSLDEIYAVSRIDSDDLKYIKNKSLELQAMLDVNKLLIDKVANEPIVNSWFEWGSVVLKMIVINPSSSQARTIDFQHYLPREAEPKYIIDREDLELDYDQEQDLWYVHKEIKLEPGESVVKKVQIKDVWVIATEEIDSLRQQAEELMKPLEGTNYFAQAATLKSETDKLLDSILRKQKEYKASPEEHIVTFRENKESLQAAESNVVALKTLVAEVSGKSGILGSLFGVSTTMVWAIILIVVVGVSVLMILLYSILMRSRALEEYIAPGKKLKAPPVIGIKQKATKIKGGFMTYFLPPFGEQTVDVKRLAKLIKILSIVVIIIIIILIAVYFLSGAFLSKNTAPEDAPMTNNVVNIDESENKPNLEETITYTEEAGDLPVQTGEEEILEEETPSEAEVIQKKLKITETGTGWLNARSEPSVNSETIVKVNVGDEFIYTDEIKDTRSGNEVIWYKIITEQDDLSTSTGWVYGEYIEIITN